jgi:hypothetical protein
LPAPYCTLMHVASTIAFKASTERYAEYDPQYLKEVTAAIEDFWLRTVSGQPFAEKWCRARESNPRPSVYKTAALPLS